MEVLKSLTREEANEKFARDCQEGLNLTERGYEAFKAFAEKVNVRKDFKEDVEVAVEIGGFGFDRNDLDKVIENNITYIDIIDYVNHPYENTNNKLYNLDTVCREFARLFYLFRFKYLFLVNGEDFLTVA